MLSLTQIETYRKDGYIVLENAVPSETLARLQRFTDEMVAGAAGVEAHTSVYDLGDGHTPDTPQVRRIKLPHKAHLGFRAFAGHPSVVDPVSSLLGPNVRLHGGKINLKSGAGGDAVEWHQDWAFYPHTNDDMLAVGVMLDDMDKDNGPVLMLPGTHTGPVHDHHVEGAFAGAMDIKSCGIDFGKARTVTGKAGSISIHHVRLVHGSAANRSGRPRRLLLWEYAACDAWPLMGVGDFEEFSAQVVQGEPSIMPRLVDIPVRMPFPPAPHQGSIFENQRSAAKRYFTSKAA